MSTNVDGRLGARAWFVQRCIQVLNYRPSNNNATWERYLKSFFGVSFSVLERLNDLLNLQTSIEREHLLWALHFLKVYNCETVSARLWKVTEKTYRQYLHPMIARIGQLELVRSVFG